MRGWDRTITKKGDEAKALKHFINSDRIRPKISADANELYQQANPAPRTTLK